MNPIILTSTTTTETSSFVSIISTILPFALLIVVMYFLIIRPQRKKEKETQSMRNNIQIGDIVVTIGGIEGIVVNIKEDTLLLESGDNRNKIRVKRWAVQTNETVHEEAKAESKKKKNSVQ
jgi:preprotein translocase subunit YajC